MATDQLRAGDLDTPIAIQRKSVTYSPSGEPVETWGTLFNRRASIRPLLGDERNGAEQLVGREQSEFKIRWSLDVATLSPLDRIVCPASDAGISPVNSRSIYDVFAVHEIGRNIGLRVLAARTVA